MFLNILVGTCYSMIIDKYGNILSVHRNHDCIPNLTRARIKKIYFV